jgi:hypothetical protein
MHIELIARLEKATGKVARVVEGDGAFEPEHIYRQDGVRSKHDRCAHLRYAYEGCITCAEQVLWEALEELRDCIAALRAKDTTHD